ncbi:sulfur carrier protein [Streptoalloteichus hindustanus]|uniref:Sulfur carrier protein n=2 Tax=Streptoalloteichus hindustanus TaxID=2017 RepID=A0A1M4W8G5_STRHI|nr:sulfur carrier protein ThiS [Streptoalloteichus hindustanus]SHE77516.1 sulfur carrier protein [Streptoalloteichus hindustanus]
MRVRVNGEDREFAEAATVADVLVAFGTPAAGVAVAMDGDVVPRGVWQSTPLRDGATVEVLTAVQGG